MLAAHDRRIRMATPMRARPDGAITLERLARESGGKRKARARVKCNQPAVIRAMQNRKKIHARCFLLSWLRSPFTRSEMERDSALPASRIILLPPSSRSPPAVGFLARALPFLLPRVTECTFHVAETPAR